MIFLKHPSPKGGEELSGQAFGHSSFVISWALGSFIIRHFGTQAVAHHRQNILT